MQKKGTNQIFGPKNLGQKSFGAKKMLKKKLGKTTDQMSLGEFCPVKDAPRKLSIKFDKIGKVTGDIKVVVGSDVWWWWCTKPFSWQTQLRLG